MNGVNYTQCRKWDREKRQKRNRSIAVCLLLVALLFALCITGEADYQNAVQVEKEMKRITYRPNPLLMVEIKQLMGRW